MDAKPETSKAAPALAFPEFIGLMALLMALTALSIDIMLPALPAITSELGATAENDRQLVVTAYLIGLGFGQLVWGPLSDRIGRRMPLLIGLALYATGALAACLSGSFAILLAARSLQGIGGAAARTIGTAVVRDAYQGRQMARVMSFVMTVFILVPVLAPTIGQAIMLHYGWRASFVVLLSTGVVAFAWVLARLPETLPDTFGAAGETARHGLAAGIRIVLGNRITIGYGLASGFMFGTLVSYISSAQQIFVDHFKLG
ncbi:MAG: MFS transporter, partial [Proteobacteria bacterium]|nr:MFS transporter [Pseudomonadota bacterium]